MTERRRSARIQLKEVKNLREGEEEEEEPVKKKGRGGKGRGKEEAEESREKEEKKEKEEMNGREGTTRPGMPHFVANIIMKRAQAKQATFERPETPMALYDDEGDKAAARMRELVTLVRILSTGRFEEISEGEAAMAIGNTTTEHRAATAKEEEEKDESSSSEDEWEEMELADPDQPSTSGHIQIHVTKSQLPKAKGDWKSKWLRTEVNRRIRENREVVHMVSVLCLMCHCRRLVQSILHENLLPCLMLTQLPQGYQSLAGHPIDDASLSRLVKWFADAYRQSPVPLVHPPRGDNRYEETSLMEMMAEKKEYETSTHAAMLLFAILHSLETVVRLCCNFNLRFGWEKREEKKKKGRGSREGKGPQGSKGPKGRTEGDLEAWVELWMPQENVWRPVDPVRGKLLEDDEIEALLLRPIHYIFAADNKKGLREISFRISSTFLTPQFRRRRPIEVWLKETLALPIFRADGNRSRMEDCEWHARIEERDVPKTINELKQHPLYVMEKDLKKYEAIYPPDAQPVAVVKNEKVFLRSNVHHLQGTIHWVKFGRQIKAGESPYRTTTKRGRAKGETATLPLYGFWQTEPYVVPQIVDGRIPMNEFGNIYMYKPDMCPKGAVHLRLPGMVSMARKLGKQAVPAIVGWQCQAGHNVPIVEGAVVLKEDADEFVREMKRRVREEKEKAMKKYESRIWGNWRRLILGAVRLSKMRERFGEKKGDGGL